MAKNSVYCGDIAGAFHRISNFKLLAELDRSIISLSITRVIANWLVGRRCKVVVKGYFSDIFYCSTLLIRALYGVRLYGSFFFADAPLSVCNCRFQEISFADELNAFLNFLNSVSNGFALS